MENSLWHRFVQFVKSSFQEKFKVFLPGAIAGLFGAKSLLFAGLPPEAVTFGTYVLKYIGTVLMAFSSGLATAYAAFLIEKHKENQKKSPSGKRKNNRAA
jgi:hypothetical protein